MVKCAPCHQAQGTGFEVVLISRSIIMIIVKGRRRSKPSLLPQMASTSPPWTDMYEVQLYSSKFHEVRQDLRQLIVDYFMKTYEVSNLGDLGTFKSIVKLSFKLMGLNESGSESFTFAACSFLARWASQYTLRKVPSS